jgi:hypothetical protein
MTYQFVSAIAKPFNGDGHWVNANIGNVPFNQIFSTYSRTLITLSNNFLTSNVGFDLEQLRETHSGLTTTFNQFLIDNANAALATTTTLPELRTRYVKYADLFKTNYKIQPTTPFAPPDTDHVLQDKTWLHLSKPSIDYSDFYNYCLVNVNGFFHLTDFDTSGVYVKDGMKSKFISGKAEIGALDFTDIGKLTFIPITESMVYKQTPDQVFKNACFVDIDVSTKDKTVALVLGGYLHVLDSVTFKQIGDTLFHIDFSNLPLLERYYESRKYIDLSSLSLETTNRNDSLVGMQELYSDAVLLKYLTLSQSFFVIIDNLDMFVRRDYLHATPAPNKYISYTKPEFPIVTGFGKITNFWSVYEDKQWSIACSDSFYNNYLFNTVKLEDQPTASNARVPEAPVTNSKAFFLKIGSDI